MKKKGIFPRQYVSCGKNCEKAGRRRKKRERLRKYKEHDFDSFWSKLVQFVAQAKMEQEL